MYNDGGVHTVHVITNVKLTILSSAKKLLTFWLVEIPSGLLVVVVAKETAHTLVVAGPAGVVGRGVLGVLGG